MKRILTLTTRCLLLALGLLFSHYTQAQVTIGSGDAAHAFSVLEISTQNVKGGLRLPHLTTAERTALSQTQAFMDEQNRPNQAALGLTIYNTTTQCVEYWDGYKWVSLCLGSAEIGFENESGTAVDITQPGFPVDGDTKGPFLPVAVPACDNTVKNPPYSFTLMTGGDYTTINVIDPSTGKFTITMELNPTASSRTAILRVTDNCTGEYKEFVFSQEGDDTTCTGPAVPDIKSNSSTELCQNGALYLYLDGYPTTGTFIWTLNGTEIGRGNNIAVTEPGRYVVYGDLIGCTNKKEITITRGSESAPAAVDVIVVGNNGEACGSGGTVDLIVTSTMDGTIVWYKDGKKTALTGNQILADAGTWFAVVENTDCTSLPTKEVTVRENTSGTSITPPTIMINGVTAGWSICKGGSMFLQVDTPETGIKYTWYINNDEIGSGTALYHPVPSGDSFVLRLRATGSGCAVEALVVETVSPSQAPNPPYITTNTGDMLCGGEATLTATNSTGATSYRWYKDGVEITGQTAASITVTTTGSYTVSAINSGCTSIQSAAKTIAASDFATVSWVSHPTTANIGDTKTYSVSIDFAQGVTYNWTVTGGTITNGQGTNSITVKFDADGTATVTCEAENACGPADESPLSENVTVSPACTDAKIKNTSNLTPSIKVSKQTTLSVTAEGTNRSYQWYSGAYPGGTPVPSGGTGSSYTYTATAAGSFTFYCVVAAAAPCVTPAISPLFTVTVTPDPEDITTGNGSFNGKTCFDIAQGNDGENSCGATISRAGQKTTFSNRTAQDPATGDGAPYSGVQVYTFTPTGTVNNVRFEYNESTDNIIDSIVPKANYAIDNISSACKVTVYFNKNLDTQLKNLTRQTALKVELYAIYRDANIGGNEKKLKLNLTLQDCACCGAKTVDGGWLTFMCHNLGADESLDPFTYNPGSYFQWGRKADGHEVYGSTAMQGRATTTSPDNAIFYIKYANWTTVDDNTLWGNPTATGSGARGANDPCPAGWRIPSAEQWQSIINAPNSPWTWTGNGYKIGDALYLSAAGNRKQEDGKYQWSAQYGYYWSNNIVQGFAQYLWIGATKGTQINLSTVGRAYGASVRCVAE